MSLQEFVDEFEGSNGELVLYNDRIPCYKPEAPPIRFEESEEQIELLHEAQAALRELSELIKSQGFTPTEWYTTRIAISACNLESGGGVVLEDFKLTENSNVEVTDSKGGTGALLGLGSRNALIWSIKNLADSEFRGEDLTELHDMITLDDIEQKGFRDEVIFYGDNSDPDYIPTNPELIEDMVSGITTILNDNQYVDVIAIPISNYYINAVSPYTSGNMRLSCIVDTFLFVKFGILPSPILDLATYFYENTDEYYNHLLNVSKKGEWDEWLEFYLNAIIEQAEEAKKEMNELIELEEELNETYGTDSVMSNTAKLGFIKALYTPYDVQNMLDEEISIDEIESNMEELEEEGILTQVEDNPKNYILTTFIENFNHYDT